MIASLFSHSTSLRHFIFLRVRFRPYFSATVSRPWLERRCSSMASNTLPIRHSVANSTGLRLLVSTSKGHPSHPLPGSQQPPYLLTRAGLVLALLVCTEQPMLLPSPAISLVQGHHAPCPLTARLPTGASLAREVSLGSALVPCLFLHPWFA